MANALDHLNAGRTRLEWLSQLNTNYHPAKEYRRTSIICTIGTLCAGRKLIGQDGTLMSSLRAQDKF
jgi:hypothetical protein